MHWLMSLVGLGCVVALELSARKRHGVIETGARRQRGSGAPIKGPPSVQVLAKQAAKRQKRRARSLEQRLADREVSCCDAYSDDWRSARAVYDRWRPPVQRSYREVAGEMFRESQEYAARGDYSKPASRRAVLGRMHQEKLAQWLLCRQACAGDRALDAVPQVFDGDGDALGVWFRGVTLNVRPSRAGFAVDDGERELEWFEARHEAVEWAQEWLVDELGDVYIPDGDEVPF